LCAQTASCGCPKVRSFANASTHGGSAYSVGALAHFLKNRFYIAEVVYRGDIHAGEHAPIIDRSTFDAVEAKLAENVRARRLRVSNSPAILMGRIFDDRGNRMTPSHSNKDGVRHRYYVSHAMLQRRKQDAGRVARVPAIELKRLWSRRCVPGWRRPARRAKGYVERIIVRPDAVDIELKSAPGRKITPLTVA
jgi:site-specific DNA recombinase